LGPGRLFEIANSNTKVNGFLTTLCLAAVSLRLPHDFVFLTVFINNVQKKIADGSRRRKEADTAGLHPPPYVGGYQAETIPWALPCFALLLAGLIGCRTVPPLPTANLSEPGWTIQQGQAVWRAKRAAPEFAGEILLATNVNGRVFVQFTKTPFPFLIAQSTTNTWQVEIPSQNKRYSGRGMAPLRIIWLQLPRALAGSTLPGDLSWHPAPDGHWRLDNLKTGETLEGYFTR
jgi:hypothetical protein